MKLKNIAVGDFVQVKKSMCHSKFKAKEVYEVIDINLTNKHGFDVLIRGKNYLNWVSHEHLKKPESQLRQLDQSVFNGLDEKWRWLGVNSDGSTIRATDKPTINIGNNGFVLLIGDSEFFDDNYDTSNWRNSLIERDIAKKPKQLDQSVFKGSPDWAVSAAISPNGKAYVYSVTGDGFYGISDKYGYQIRAVDRAKCIGGEYDASNWQKSLIERDSAAKELLEVDLTGELTGSELCRAMLARGDKCVLIRMGERDDKQAKEIGRFAIATGIDEAGRFNVMSDQQPINKVDFAVPINNQGEPLTAAEVGL